MKKVFMSLMIVATVALASCNNNTTTDAASVDTTAVDSTAVDSTACCPADTTVEIK